MKREQTQRIGSVAPAHPFLLAPLAGVTDSAFRRICRRQGAALVYSEMVSAKGLFYNDKGTERLLAFAEEETPIALQLFGSEPDIMAWAVKRLSDRPFCLLDINMGCPVPKVAKNGEGSALMKDPLLAARIVRAMCAAEKEAAETSSREAKPITIKCRIGWDKDTINVLDFARRMEEAGASAIAVHGRTREQYYSGKADWEMIERVKGVVGVPVIGSGDVFTAEDANRMIEQTSCDFVMIARGALGHPWIFREAEEQWNGTAEELRGKQPSPTERATLILQHLELTIAEKGTRQAVLEMRKHMGWYLKGFPGAAEVRRQVNAVTDPNEIRQLVRTYFEPPGFR